MGDRKVGAVAFVICETETMSEGNKGSLEWFYSRKNVERETTARACVPKATLL